MKKTIFIIVISVVLAIFAGSCSQQSDQEVVVYTSVDQVFANPVLRAFEEHTGIPVRAVFDTEETKSTGVLNRLIAESEHPQADVFWSGDPVRPFVLIRRGMVERYASPEAQALPKRFKAVDGAWASVASRARVLLVNQERLGDRRLPRSVQALADPRWRGEAALANPLFGTTTVHVAAWFTAWGESYTKDFLNRIKENEVRIASSNGEVKRLVVSGEVTFGLLDTDDAADAIRAGAPVELLYPDQEGLGALILPTTVVLMQGGPNPKTARQLVDFLLSSRSENLLVETGGYMPLHKEIKSLAQPVGDEEQRAMHVDYAQVAETMERIQPWLRAWVGL